MVGHEGIAGLIGRLPDVERDRALLETLCDDQDPAADQLAAALLSDTRARRLPLRRSFPGLGAIDAEKVVSLDSVEPTAALLRAGVVDWGRLRALSPNELLRLPGVGQKVLGELLAGVARRWARLQRVAVAAREHPSDDPVEEHRPRAGSAEGHLLTIGAWGREVGGIEDVRGALVAALGSAEGTLPPEVRAALEALDEGAPAEPDPLRGLTQSFEQLEGRRQAFEIYRRRRLCEGRPPRLADLAAWLGISRQRVSQLQADMEEEVADQLRDPRSPLRIAAGRLRARLGPLATPREVPGAFATIDPYGSALRGAPQRRALLLCRACGYRVDGDWVLDNSIEARTEEVLATMTSARRPPTLLAVRRALRGLGIREALQRPWVESRSRYRFVGFGPELVRWGPSMLDRAVAVLSVGAAPLELEDLLARIGADGASPRAFKDRLRADPRFVRVGRNSYRLTGSW